MFREPRNCHYCGSRGSTKDHVVPRMRVRELDHRVDTRRLRRINLVPACGDCNHLKGDVDSGCWCAKCFAAWDLYGILAAIAADATKPRHLGGTVAGLRQEGRSGVLVG